MPIFDQLRIWFSAYLQIICKKNMLIFRISTAVFKQKGFIKFASNILQMCYVLFKQFLLCITCVVNNFIHFSSLFRNNKTCYKPEMVNFSQFYFFYTHCRKIVLSHLAVQRKWKLALCFVFSFDSKLCFLVY